MRFLAQDLLTPHIMDARLRTCDAERSALVAEALRGCGRLRLQVHGESMLPTLWPRDVVEISSCSLAELQPGDIVLAQREGRFFLHRFVGRHPDGFLLRGDSMPQPDPPFEEPALLGRLSDQTLAMRAWTWVFGRLACHCGFVRHLMLTLHALGERRQNRTRLAPRASLDGTV